MRILQLAHSLFSAGGVESYVRRLSAGLVARGHQLAVVGGDEPDAGWPPGLAGLHVVPGYGQFGAPREKAEAVLRLADEFRPEAVLIQEMNNYPLALELARRRPVVKYAHVDFTCASGGTRFRRRTRGTCLRRVGPACLWHYYADRCGPGWDPRWALWSYRRSTGALRTWRQLPRVLVASGFMRRLLLACGFADEQVAVLPLFVPEAEASPRAAEAAGAPEVLFVGRIMPEKGLDDLVRALPLVKAPCRLVVVGDGPARGAAEGLAARLGLAGRVSFAGWQQDVEPYWRRASLLVVPSLLLEPFGIVGLEAMARALPVVAYRSGGIPEWLEDGVTGRLVEPGDVAGLAAAVGALLADAALARKLGAAGQERQRARFGPERHLAALEKILTVR